MHPTNLRSNDPTPAFVSRSQPVSIAGPVGGILEGAILNADRENNAGIAVVLHPHPLYGGTMSNKVVVSVAKAFAALGFVALRFNYRGVGNSTGEYDGGRGETDDAVAAIDWLRSTHATGPLWIAGFSFGTYVGLRAASERPPAGLITIAPAVNVLNFDDTAIPSCPWLVIQGDRDELVPVTAVLNWLSPLRPRPMLIRMKGAGHFFHGRLNDVRNSVIHFVERSAPRGNSELSSNSSV